MDKRVHGENLRTTSDSQERRAEGKYGTERVIERVEGSLMLRPEAPL